MEQKASYDLDLVPFQPHLLPLPLRTPTYSCFLLQYPRFSLTFSFRVLLLDPSSLTWLQLSFLSYTQISTFSLRLSLEHYLHSSSGWQGISTPTWTGSKLNSSSSSSRLGVLMTSFLTSVFLPVDQIKKLKIIFTLHPYPMFHPLTCQQNHQILSSLPLFYVSRISFLISRLLSGSGRSLAAQDLDPPFTLLSSLKGRGNLYSQCQSLCPWIKTPNWWPLLAGRSPNSSVKLLDIWSTPLREEGRKNQRAGADRDTWWSRSLCRSSFQMVFTLL